MGKVSLKNCERKKRPKNVFQVLLEKLLYSCPDLNEIVILMRPKRGKTESERVAAFVSIPVCQQVCLPA